MDTVPTLGRSSKDLDLLCMTDKLFQPLWIVLYHHVRQALVSGSFFPG